MRFSNRILLSIVCALAGAQMLSLQAGIGRYRTGAELAPERGVRFTLTLMCPKL